MTPAEIEQKIEELIDSGSNPLSDISTSDLKVLRKEAQEMYDEYNHVDVNNSSRNVVIATGREIYNRVMKLGQIIEAHLGNEAFFK